MNEGDDAEWEDEDLECKDRSEIERHALMLIEEACTRQAVRGAESLPSTVVVYEENGGIIMSAHGWLKGAVRVRWESDLQPRRQYDPSRRHIAAALQLRCVSQIEPAV
ncbi:MULTISPECIES: hypothetical protein [Methylobacterium]|uniref:hypothetical protein n=1 Tax=Methylobacterium sp. WL9 TaxID=2603898 RepID=UPI0011C72731|nr:MULTISPECIES: hypothetical protein [Methylobacterium]TXN21773.1 hypothetical protein FV217_13265 [Methylobacterium sp. WL9]